MTTTHVPPEALARPQVQSLLGRSALYEALALSLAEPRTELLERLDVLLRDLVTHPIALRLGIARELRALRYARKDVDAERLAPVHFVLFEASVLCSPHETEYVRDPFAKAVQLADIAGFYGAFGLRVSAQHPTTPDDICTELEFVALATRREAYALVQGWDDRAAIARDASRSFLESHLGRWFEAFSADLAEQAGPAAATRDDAAVASWFRAVAALVRTAVRADLDALGVYPSRLHSRVVNDDAEGAPSCPMVAGDRGTPG